MNLNRLFLAIVASLLLAGCMNGTDTNGGQEGETENGTPQQEQEETDPNGEEVDENGEEVNGNGESKEDKESEEKVEKVEKEEKEEEKHEYSSPKEVAEDIVNAISEKDMETVGDFVHPTKGVRFSPYGYVDVESDQVFTAEEVKGLMYDDTVYVWGVFDGKGNPIEKTFAEYYERFVYDVDFANAEEIAVDERLGQGNTLDNTDEVYPEANVVEFHFSGFDPDYVGMDWRSLRIVIEEEDGQWYLVGVIHDEWTI